MEELIYANASVASVKIEEIELVRKQGIVGDLQYKIIKRSHANGDTQEDVVFREDVLTEDLEKIALSPSDLMLGHGEMLVLTSPDDNFTHSVKDN